MTKDMEAIDCDFCSHRFFASLVYQDHMRNEHPEKPLQKIIPWEKKD